MGFLRPSPARGKIPLTRSVPNILRLSFHRRMARAGPYSGSVARRLFYPAFGFVSAEQARNETRVCRMQATRQRENKKM